MNMTQLKDLQDIIDLEIKSVKEVISPNSRKDWIGMEKELIESESAPSLPAYLLYEYHFNNESIHNLAKKLEIKDNNSLRNMMIKMGIPIT